MSSHFEDGDKVRRKVLGDEHVDKAAAAATEVDKPFQKFITEGVWGSVWARPHLTLRERSMITIALLAAGGNDREVAMHLRAARRTGASVRDIQEVLLHVACYAGVPKANAAFALARKILAEDGDPS